MSEHEIPEPKKNPVACLVLSYKVSKGVWHEDKAWNAVHWARASKSAKLLLDTCGSFEIAEKCLNHLADDFEKSDLRWTFETILKHAHDWLHKNGVKNGPHARERLHHAIAQRDSARKSGAGGAPTTAGEILTSLRDFGVIPPDEGEHPRHKTGTH